MNSKLVRHNKPVSPCVVCHYVTEKWYQSRKHFCSSTSEFRILLDSSKIFVADLLGVLLLKATVIPLCCFGFLVIKDQHVVFVYVWQVWIVTLGCVVQMRAHWIVHLIHFSFHWLVKCDIIKCMLTVWQFRSFVPIVLPLMPQDLSVDLCTDSLTLGGCIHSAQPREYRKMTRMLLVALLTWSALGL